MDVISKDDLTLIEYRRNLMGGYITYASDVSKPAFIAAFDDSKRLQEVLTELQKEVVELRARVQTQFEMIGELMDERR
jgi:hypothetical protein